MSSVEAVEAKDLTKTYGDVTAVKGMDLAVHGGELFCLVGPDGAGKTTTMRMLCGIAAPSSGSVRILGLDLRKDLFEIKKRIGYLSQRFSLYGDLSVDENIEFFAEIHGVRGYRERREELLQFTRLLPFRARLADRLSGGMRQKLALACILVRRPDLLLLDEPTTGVDPVSRREFWIILSSLLREGITILMTTPYLDEAERATRIGLIDSGRLLLVDTPTAVKSRETGVFVEIVCGRVRDAHALLREGGLVREVQLFGDRLVVRADTEAQADAALRAVEESGAGVRSHRRVPPSLEHVFISQLRDKGGEG